MNFSWKSVLWRRTHRPRGTHLLWVQRLWDGVSKVAAAGERSRSGLESEQGWTLACSAPSSSFSPSLATQPIAPSSAEPTLCRGGREALTLPRGMGAEGFPGRFISLGLFL